MNNDYPNNGIEFPFNIFDPVDISTSYGKYRFYKMNFRNLYDLYNYLNSKPRINSTVFSTLESENGDKDFAGVSYNTALRNLIKDPNKGYSDFLNVASTIDNYSTSYVQEYIVENSVSGGFIDIPAYCSCNPLCYRSTKSIYTPKFIKLNVQLSYTWSTTKSQVINRALIIISLVNALEKAGYIVEINEFELSEYCDELVNINVNVKNNDQSLNKASLYKTLCNVEFLRRILFRVLETSDVRENWENGYGSTCDEKLTREVLKIKKGDIFINQPYELNIWGDNLINDLENTLECLNLSDKIDVDRLEKDFNKRVSTLKLVKKK